MKNRPIRFFLFFLGIWLVVSLSRDLWQLLQKRGRVEKMVVKKEELVVENLALKEKLEYVESEEFTEKEAREKLNMSKEGEVVVVLPEKITTADFQSANQQNQLTSENLPNYQQWLRLFF